MIARFKTSCGKWKYIVMQQNLNYEEWVWCGVSGFQLVRLILLGECDNPKIRDRAHDGCALCLSFWVYALWICVGRRPWRRPPDREV